MPRDWETDKTQDPGTATNINEPFKKKNTTICKTRRKTGHRVKPFVTEVWPAAQCAHSIHGPGGGGRVLIQRCCRYCPRRLKQLHPVSAPSDKTPLTVTCSCGLLPRWFGAPGRMFRRVVCDSALRVGADVEARLWCLLYGVSWQPRGLWCWSGQRTEELGEQNPTAQRLSRPARELSAAPWTGGATAARAWKCTAALRPLVARSLPRFSALRRVAGGEGV